MHQSDASASRWKDDLDGEGSHFSPLSPSVIIVKPHPPMIQSTEKLGLRMERGSCKQKAGDDDLAKIHI